MNLKDHIRSVPDFPKPGILFYDISTLLAHPAAWKYAVSQIAEMAAEWRPDVIAAIESRGFLLAAPLGVVLERGFIMVRKRGKLPGPTVSFQYALEYGADHLEIQTDAIKPGQRVMIVDDLLATGGTMGAAIELCRKVGAEVAGAAAIIELSFLGGRSALDVPFKSLIAYDA